MALLLRTWTRGFEIGWGRRADIAGSRSLFLPQREYWSARRRLAGTVSKAMFSQWCQRRLCCREPCGVDGRLVGPPRAPPRVLRISPGHLTPPSAPWRSHRSARVSKKPVVRRAPKQFTHKAARCLAANAIQEIMAERLEELSGRQLETPRKGAIAGACSPTPCGCFRSLKRFIAMIAAAFDESRPGSLQRQNVRHFGGGIP